METNMKQSESPADDVLTISVIMPVYNGIEFIKQSLPPLVAMKDRGEVLEVIVVDDTSSDATPEVARELGAEVMPSGGRLGPGAARNVAAQVAKGDVLWFIDADVIVHEDAARVMLEGFQESNVVGVFGSYDDEPPAQNFLSQYKNLVHHYYHQRARREASTFWSGCGAIRKDAFLAAGGFDVEM
ncbi:MAG: glycosyl transferase, partial [Pseudomonadales bacterium]|nr:glycosyl transferase [Pseudomonadales bacterium]